MGILSRLAPLAAFSSAFLALAPVRAAEPVEIHVILPLTGGGSFLGKGHQEVFEALEQVANRAGGIAGRPVHFVFHDDQSSPQVAVQLADEVLAQHPSMILGSSLVAMCAAIAPLMKDGPVDYCLSPGLHPAAGGYVFSTAPSTIDAVGTAITYFRMKGWTRLAIISSTDATGQDIDNGIKEDLARPENRGIVEVEHQHFTPGDVSVAAQMERIKAADPQALIAWTTGSTIGTIFKAVVQAGLDVPVVTTNGNQTFAQMDQYAAFLPRHLYIPSALFPEHDGLLTLDPRVEKEQHEMYAILKERNRRADTMVATSWDAGLIAIAALRKLGADATADQIRQYIANLTDFPGVNGIYDFKKYTERGLGPDSSAIVTYDIPTKSWVWLSKPGGAPLN